MGRHLAALTAAVALAAVALAGRTHTSGAVFTSRAVNPGAQVAAAADWTPPSVALADPGAAVRGTVTLTATATDGESGVAGVVVTGAPAGTTTSGAVCTMAGDPWSCTYDTTSVADGVYDLTATATDGAGSAAASTVTGVRIDNTAPAGTLSVPPGPLTGTVTATATLTEVGSGLGTVELQWSPTGTTAWSTAACTPTGTGGTCTLDTTGIAGGTYDLRVRATDAAGNTGTTPVVTRTIDHTPHAVAVQEPGSYLRGTTTFTATATSPLGVTTVRIQRAAASTGPWIDVCTDATGPYSCTVDTATIPNGATWFRALMVDGSGATTTSATVGPRTVDNSPVHGVDIQAIGTGNGYFGNGDVFLYTYSQPIQPGSLLAGWNGASRNVIVRLRDVSTGIRPSDFFEVYTDTTWTTRIEVGQVELNLNSMSGAPDHALFDGTVAMETTTVNGRQVTLVRVTVGAWRGTGNAWPNTVTAQMIWHPSGAARDTWGIATSTTAVAESGPLDKDY